MEYVVLHESFIGNLINAYDLYVPYSRSDCMCGCWNVHIHRDRSKYGYT